MSASFVFLNACIDGDLYIIKLMVSRGFNISTVGEEAISLASKHKKYNVVEYLISNGVRSSAIRWIYKDENIRDIIKNIKFIKLFNL